MIPNCWGGLQEFFLIVPYMTLVAGASRLHYPIFVCFNNATWLVATGSNFIIPLQVFFLIEIQGSFPFPTDKVIPQLIGNEMCVHIFLIIYKRNWFDRYTILRRMLAYSLDALSFLFSPLPHYTRSKSTFMFVSNYVWIVREFTIF